MGLRETNYRYAAQTEPQFRLRAGGIPHPPALLCVMKNDSCVCEMRKAGSAYTCTLKYVLKMGKNEGY